MKPSPMKGDDLGGDYVKYIYAENVRLEREISEATDAMLSMDNELMGERDLWEEEIA